MNLFDRLAEQVGRFTSRAWFFALCVLLVLAWAPSIVLIRSIDTWQLVINTATTIITFLLVALLQNQDKRSNDAVQGKLDAIADGLAVLLDDDASTHRPRRAGTAGGGGRS